MMLKHFQFITHSKKCNKKHLCMTINHFFVCPGKVVILSTLVENRYRYHKEQVNLIEQELVNYITCCYILSHIR